MSSKSTSSAKRTKVSKSKYQKPRPDDLLAGRKPRAKTGDELTVENLCNHFMAFKKDALTSGELTQRTYDRYLATVKSLLSCGSRAWYTVPISVTPWNLGRLQRGDRPLPSGSHPLRLHLD